MEEVNVMFSSSRCPVKSVAEATPAGHVGIQVQSEWDIRYTTCATSMVTTVSMVIRCDVDCRDIAT
jgi:hypothetical protein